MAFNKEEFLTALDTMTIMELNALVKAIEEKFGVSSQAVSATSVEVKQGPAVEAQTEFNVVITNIGANKIQVIKAVRELTLLGLKEAKELVESPQLAIKEGLSKADAEAAKAKLQEAGATVELK